MPDDITTGFAAYCVAVAAAFPDVSAEYVKDNESIDEGLRQDGKSEVSTSGHRERVTPEICCGAELFGFERFLSDASTRHRAWGLRGTYRGVSNRFTIFQDLWLNPSSKDQIRSVKDGINEINIQLGCINAVARLVREQSKAIDRLFQRSDADSAKYKSTVLELAKGTEKVLCELNKRKSQYGSGCPQLYSGLLQQLCEWIGEQHATLMSLYTKDVLLSELKKTLKTFDSEAYRYIRIHLRQPKKDLIAEKGLLTAWQTQPSNRDVWRKESVDNCVNEIVDGNTSILWKALQEVGAEQFRDVFSTKVTPAIEEGFNVEGYSPARISAFRTKLDTAAGYLNVGESSSSVRRYREFITVLVDSLVYGPEGDRQSIGTKREEGFEPIDEGVLETSVGNRVVVSQRLSSDGSLMGKTAIFGPNDVVFFGRQDSVESYVEKCKEFMSPEVFSALCTKKLTVFPLAEVHGQVSNLHSMMVFENGGWLYRDFSRFGTRLVGKGKDGDKLDIFFTDKPHEIRAGNVLYLGAGKQDKGQKLFFKAAAIKVSTFLDLDSIDYLL